MIGYSDIKPVPLERSFGAEADRTEVYVAPDPLELFVFWVSNHLTGSVPRVSRFDDTDAGRAQVAQLVRSETIISVVRGSRAEVETQSSVTVTLGGERLVDQAPMSTQG